MNTPNNWGVKHQPDFTILTAQLSEEQGKAFSTLIQKITAGENVDGKELEAAIQGNGLSPAGQLELLQQAKIEMVRAQNQKLIEDPELQAAYQNLNDEQKAEADHLLGNAATQTPGILQQLFTDPLKPFDPAKVKLAIEAMDDLSKVVVDVDISQEKQLVLGLHEKKFPTEFNQALMKVVGQMKRVENGATPIVAVEALFREAQFSDDTRARQLFNLPKPSLEDMKEFNDLVLASALSDTNKQNLLGILLLQPNTFVADAAEDKFMDILGHPFPDPVTGQYSAAYTGNLHSAVRTTIHRSLFGVGGIVAPTFIAGSVGHAFVRTVQNYSRVPVEEITGLRRLLGGRVWNALGNNATARRIFRNFNPWVGAIGLGVLGTVFTVSPYGEELREFASQAVSYPYFPWSDAAARDLPLEGVQLYIGTCASLQGMDAVLLGFKTLGTLELGTRFMNIARSFQVGARLANRIEKRLPGTAAWLRGSNFTGVKGVWTNIKNGVAGRTEAQIAEAALKNADDAASAWAADVPGLNTAERLWAKAQYEEAVKQLAIKRNFAGGARLGEIREALGQAGIDDATKEALLAELGEITKNITPNLLTGIRQMEIRVQSLRVLGKVGPFPEFSKSILARAQKWIREGSVVGNTELIDRAWLLIEKGAVQYAQLPMMGMQNQKLAKFMLWMLFQEKVDMAMRPPTPVTPPFPEAIAAGVITAAQGPQNP